MLTFKVTDAKRRSYANSRRRSGRTSLIDVAVEVAIGWKA